MTAIADRRALLAWFDANRRDLPWRRTKDPYAIWVSEVMLQQTQVTTVLPYYERWMQRFPTVESLSAASEQEVLTYWAGLGYYRRCRLLMAGAKVVATRGMPQSENEWRRVPGVGRYTAAAIASIAFSERVGLVDGNVLRVFARLTCCADAETIALRKAWLWASTEVDSRRPGDWNQALMELGATVCRPKSPLCGSCPLNSACVSFRDDVQDKIPPPKTRPPSRALRHEAVIHTVGDKIGLERIPTGEWWEGMWRFPREAAPSSTPVFIGSFKHVVTHHRITLRVSVAECSSAGPHLRWVEKGHLDELPMPAPQRKALELWRNHQATEPLG